MTPFSPFLSIFILSLSTAFLSLQASPENRDTHLLISFKAALPNSSVLQNWNSNQDPCGFSGVLCQESRVSSIDLSFLPLSIDFRFVSSYLLVLEKLEFVSLVYCNITGVVSFPAGFKCSSVLGSLDLAQNSLSDPVSALSELNSCSNLKSLNVSSNFLEWKESKGLQLGVEVLDLSINKISAPNVVSWVVSGSCSGLKHLDLKGNKITDEINVSGCKDLQFLDVSSNNFSSEAPSLGDCSSLQHLDISSNKLFGNISRAISFCTHLNFLNISSNSFVGTVNTKNRSRCRHSSGFQC